MRLFVNGEVNAELEIGHRTINSTRLPVEIGGAKGIMNNVALIDNAMLWNRALAPGEIRAQMSAPTVGDGLVGWWPFDAESGLADRSDRRNPARLHAAGSLWTDDIPHDARHRPNQVLWVSPE